MTSIISRVIPAAVLALGAAGRIPPGSFIPPTGMTREAA
jgi:hypothetical protein